MESKGFEYFAFISYSHKDQELAKRLKKRLQSYHLPSRLRKSYPGLPKKLRPVFLDESSLVSIDESLQKSLYINLDNSNYLIVICSPNSAQSVYVNDEVKHFIETGKIAHIVPLIVEGVPHSGDEATECFPPAIRNLPREQELLGVDLTKFGERDAFLRVIATMLGLNLDRFVQDEIRERRRKIAIFSSIAAVLVITFGMLFWHNIDFFHAMLHNASSQYNLGEMYFYGREVEKDYGKAMEWYQRAAANGNSNAQFSIGYMYHRTTTLSSMVLTPRIATSGWLMIGEKLSMPYMPRFVIVKVPPRSFSGGSLPSRASLASSLTSAEISVRLFLSASTMLGTTRPLSRATATPMLT